MVKFSHYFENFTFAKMTWLIVVEYLTDDHGYAPFDVVKIPFLFPRSWPIIRLLK